MRPLIWFRNDLRVTDNTALLAASTRADGGAAAVFLVSRKQWAKHDWGLPKIDFILRNVVSLAETLATLNVQLHVLEAEHFADAPEALVRFAKEHKCDELLFNREYEVNEIARDDAVRNRFSKAGIEVSAFDDQTVLPPDLLRTGAGQFYRVFTPFKKSWLDAVKQRLPLHVGKKPSPFDGVVIKDVNAKVFRLRVERDGTGGTIARHWPAGEHEAQRRLKTFIAQRVNDYKKDRDFPALDGTSTLSPYLSAGVISPRQCLLAAMQSNDGQLEGGSIGIATWISELVWREFYRHVMVGFPRICKYQPFRQETRDIQWRDDEKGFTAWCDGRTGVPIVDAAMRQLRDTGWMHNRLRMVSAMYLTKDLFIDWRKGERFFMQHLVDADLAQNNGGWQWSASTGTDAAPYFRIFNPISQSRRFDPQGTFIRQYCPQLSELDDKAIHDPSELPPLLRAQIDYPEPIIDHKKARQRVMDAFGAIK